MSGSTSGFFFLILLVMLSVLLWLLHRTRLGVFVREKIADRPRRRLFVASVSFFLTFATVRGMVFASLITFHLFTTSSWRAATSITWCLAF